MNSLNDSCVLFFIKYPIKGQVKTRLSAELGTAVTVELYRNFILDTLSALQHLNVPFKICYHPDSAKEKIIEWLGRQYSYMPQSGENLGERMKNAFLHAFGDNFRRVIIIGSDSPDLPVNFLVQAIHALESHNAVIGPSRDGGYYLIGFPQSHFLQEAFENISWGGDTVFRQTVDILNRHLCSIYILPQWYDVDTLADLNGLMVRSRNTDFRKSKTFACLLQIEDNKV